MAETRAEKAAAIVAGPGGGLLFTALLAQTGCTEPVLFLSACPVGQATDVFGLTLGGLVGVYDNAGIYVVSIVIAVAVYMLVDAFTKKPT